MSNSMINALNSRMRMTGMASGLDTDMMVQKIMQVERIKVDRVKQQRQIMEWRRDDYRAITSALKKFQDENFDILSSKANMRFPSTFKKFTTTLTGSSSATATALPSAVPGTHRLAVTRLAEAAAIRGDVGVSRNITASTGISDFTAAEGKEFVLDVDGARKVIKLDGFLPGAGNEAANISRLQTIIDNNIGSGKVKAELAAGGRLMFSAVPNSGVSKISVFGASVSQNDALRNLGFDSNSVFSNRISQNSSLSTISRMTNTALTFKPEFVGSKAASLDFSEATSKFTVAINGGEIIEVVLNQKFETYEELRNSIQSQIGGGVNVSFNENNILTISLNGPGSLVIGHPEEEASALNALGLQAGEGMVEFGINGKNFKFNSSATLRDVIRVIDADSTAGVNFRYDEVSDSFSLTSSRMGAISSIDLSESGSSFLAALGLNNPANYSAGQDGVFVYNGTTIVRSTNSFTIGGVSFTALKPTEPGEELRVDVSQDVDGVLNTIKDFIEKYNQLIETINTKFYQEKSRKYLPLTDEQKEAMKDRDVEKWEEIAKSGLLKGDSTLSTITTRLRRTVYDAISGMGLPSNLLGITTIRGSEGVPKDRGKLAIDESKLRAAIINDPDLVAELFTKESSIPYSPDLSEADRSTRYRESGIIQRMFDVLQDNIRTVRSKKGEKGILLEKAGIIGDITEFSNAISKDISKTDLLIDTLLGKLSNKENALYKKFATMEKAMSTMQSQSSWLAQQFGGGR